MKHIAQLFTILFLVFSGAASFADTKEEDAKLEALSNQLKTITYRLDRGNYDQADLSAWTKVVIKLSGEASVCISDSEAKIKKVQESIDALGEKVDDEASEVTKERVELQKQKEELDKALSQCNLFKQRSDKASEHISLAEKSYFQEK
jgi:small-conductance mechanosensitive channel